jgi:hypothetical protein
MKPATGSSTQKGYSFSLIISTKLFIPNPDIEKIDTTNHKDLERFF